ncbi:uncharacterized protein AC631_02416 [Debaryomyces fabryi]|uniref:Protein MUM2 n=1 Tax=Debaryomyces fabryi TaxID=58627 RepID=A0A0V1Q017_9ASCO|nr:uncharacterized protein AC631_02416 [Debaryomyces fabryi]KSA01808.1 hypothetical protein AC631_02416 [Debaryomyces fabryi]
MSNESSQQSMLTENPLVKFWQTNNYKNSITSPIHLQAPTNFQTGTFQTQANNVEAIGNNNSMNVNAPSYVPYNYSNNHQHYDKYYNNQSCELYDRSSLQNFAINASKKDKLQEELERTKVDLVIKNQLIKNLSDQLNSLNKLKNVKHGPSNTFKVPQNYYELFKDLTKSLKEKTVELEETKERLESIVVALSMNNQRSLLVNGEFDEQELAHKIINKLSLLQSENENLLKMISSSNKLSLIIELGLLKNENCQLKEKLKNFEK